MASSVESMRLLWPEPMPWILSSVPMTTAFERVKQATVQQRRAARTSSSVGFRLETTSTDVRRDDLRIEPLLDEQAAGDALELEPVVLGGLVEGRAHPDDAQRLAARPGSPGRPGREAGGVDDLDVARAFDEEPGQRRRRPGN